MPQLKSPICPYCGHKLEHLRFKFQYPQTVRKIIKYAKKERSIKELAIMYANMTGASYRSSRKAVERLAKDGYLKRTRVGYYSAT